MALKHVLKYVSDLVDLSASLASLELHPRIVLVRVEAARQSKTSSRPASPVTSQLPDPNQAKPNPVQPRPQSSWLFGVCCKQILAIIGSSRAELVESKSAVVGNYNCTGKKYFHIIAFTQLKSDWLKKIYI